MYPKLTLRPGRNASIMFRHPWIFSGALEPVTDNISNGAIVAVVERDGTIVATGTYSPRSMIAVRVLSFGEATIDREWLQTRIAQAEERRRLLGIGSGADSNAYRVVFGESDGLPGLVVDRYADVVVIQVSTAGMEQFREAVVSCLVDLFKPAGVFERSDIPARIEEGLESEAGTRYGDVPELVEFREHGRRYLADVKGGQKTGFYLDQRDLRQEVFRMASGRQCLDLFSYSGAAGLAALAGGAASVDCVDSSAAALALCRQQAELNGLDSSRLNCREADVFQWLSPKSTPEYDLVMLDPPALIKSKRHLEAGSKGYHFLNRAALRLVKDGGLLVTSSCSAYFTEEDFALTLKRAAQQTNVELSLIRKVYQSPDHPLSLNFPEAAYLKSFICQVRH
jgi:23S rRNA (cytosine1962-C5)-methyltransferase